MKKVPSKYQKAKEFADEVARKMGEYVPYLEQQERNWHEIVGSNGMCKCGQEETCTANFKAIIATAVKEERERILKFLDQCSCMSYTGSIVLNKAQFRILIEAEEKLNE